MGQKTGEIIGNRASNEDDVKTTSPHDTFNKLVEAVMCGRVIPFLGAGVSLNSKYKGVKKRRDKPSTSSLTKRLVQYLTDLSRNCKTAHNTLQGSLNGKKVNWQNLEPLGLAWLAELVLDLNGGNYVKLCKILKIKRFNHLEPTRAHRYIAFLAREKRVQEVITTNYDCCLEQAFKETFHLFIRRKSPLCIISDSSDYEHRFANGCPLLTIYKINGCAARYKKNPKRNAFQIILAENDLQDWHGQKWAQRMFLDRLWQSSVVFTGFGSEEAQVRFDIVALYKEMGPVKSGIKLQRLCDQPNTPFIQEFSTNLNRFQRQIMNAWFKARYGDEKWKRVKREKREKAILANSLTGKHGKYFREDKDELTADRFWEAVFISAWKRLIKKEFTSGATGWFLKYLHADFDPVDFIDDLFYTVSEQCDRCCQITLQDERDTTIPLIPLMCCIEKSRIGDINSRDNKRHCLYYPIAEQGFLVGLFVLLLAWSNKNTYFFHFSPISDAYLGLWLPRMSAGFLETWIAWSTHGESFLNLEQGNLDESRQEEKDVKIVFIQIVVNTPGDRYTPSVNKAKRIHLNRTSLNNEYYNRCYGICVDVGELLGLAVEKQREFQDQHHGSRWIQFCDALDYVVDHPWTWFSNKRPSFRDRMTQIEAK